jgi:hypothetical protein
MVSLNLVTEPAPPAIGRILETVCKPKRPRWMRVILTVATTAVGTGTAT